MVRSKSLFSGGGVLEGFCCGCSGAVVAVFVLWAVPRLVCPAICEDGCSRPTAELGLRRSSPENQPVVNWWRLHRVPRSSRATFSNTGAPQTGHCRSDVWRAIRTRSSSARSFQSLPSTNSTRNESLSRRAVAQNRGGDLKSPLDFNNFQ